MSDDVKAQAVAVRAALEASGLDHGPRSTWRRFVYPAPNACWQLDATEYVLTGGRKCVIFQLIHDHSRFAVASHAVASHAAAGETAKDAIAVFAKAVIAHGVPQRLDGLNGEVLAVHVRPAPGTTYVGNGRRPRHPTQHDEPKPKS